MYSESLLRREGHVLMQGDILPYLFIYLCIYFPGSSGPPTELINAVSVLRPLWVNAATRLEEIR